MKDSLLEIEQALLIQHNVQPNEEYEIDVFDENDLFLCTIQGINNKQH
jgi:hypothetical protein